MVFLKHFDDMDSVYIVKDVHQFNDLMISIICDKSRLILFYNMSNIFLKHFLKII